MIETRTGTKFPDAVTAVTLPAGQVWDGTSGDITPVTWEAAEPATAAQTAGFIDFQWYEEQRVQLAARAAQVASVNESLSSAWYKVIRRSLTDLPIQMGGRSILNPEYGANLRAISTALALAPRTLSSYRTAVSRMRDQAHFRQLIKGTTWSGLVFSLNSSPAYRAAVVAEASARADGPRPGHPPVRPLIHQTKPRLVVQVPTRLVEFLMEHGLEGPDVTAVVVSHLRQPKVQRELLKLFRSAAERDDAA